MKTIVNRENKKKGPRRRRKSPPKDETPLEEFSRKLNKLSQMPSPQAGPRLFKEGAGGTLEQVGREADNAWAGVKKIMSLLNVEGKAFDYSSSGTSTYAGALLNCSQVAQGVGDNQRTGDSMKITRLRANFKLVYTSGNVLVQLVVGRSKDAIPAIADVFDTLGTGYAGLSFENHDQRKADKWLWHRTVRIDATKPTEYVSCDLHGLGVDTLFANATTNQTSGTYWVAILCDNVSGPVYTVNIRSDFVDN
jgi:hypothetical protein